MIVVFTNQSKLWKHDQIKNVMGTLNIPVFIVIATDKTEYKPNPVLFTTLVQSNYVDKDKSFYVGDALGRKSDFADSDKVFADNIGIPVYAPEVFFETEKAVFEMPIIPLSLRREIIIMVGYPGSGKSTIAKHICENKRYVHIEGDVYKTKSKIMKSIAEEIKMGKSIVIDVTNMNVEKRA